MIPPANPDKLTRPEIKAVFKRHRGAKTKLAQDLNVTKPRIADWFGRRGSTPEIDKAIRQRAAELINEERAQAEERKGRSE